MTSTSDFSAVSLIGPEGKFMTLKVLVHEYKDFKYVLEITGVWVNVNAPVVSRWVGGDKIAIDSAGISSQDVNVRGIAKIMCDTRHDYVSVDDRVEVDAELFLNRYTDKLFVGSDFPVLCSNAQLDRRREFERMELAARPRINLELAAKIPGDVNVVIWK